MKKLSNDFFWPSYVDLMTSLFIIMLVLFILSFKALTDEKRVSEEKLQKIEEVQEAVNQLPAELFIYEKEYKRYTLTKQIQFAFNSYKIPETDYDYLYRVGKELQNMLEKLKQNYLTDKIKYLIVIEGMASKIGGTPESNYILSFNRAKSIVEFWQAYGIKFDPEICEIMVSGSGWGGIGRFSGEEEYKNQRILIQIIPKLSNFLEEGRYKLVLNN
ncbi:MAG TPA: OmpA family protein [Ignavibacteriales bacterium]|jgi:outer membrane protein OmpA-like peptidoglycan-associated protein|nr:OmpA family protein [Ignavibacteriales bacterium]